MTSHYEFRSTSMNAARTLTGMRALAFAILFLASLHALDVHAGTATGSLAIASDDVFRGISQSNRKPSLQGSLEYGATNGLYVGTWDGNVNWLSDQSTSEARVSNSLEIDLYAGYRRKFGGKTTLDVGVLSYTYPGTYPAGFTHPDTTEAYAGVTYGVATLKASHALGNLFGYARSKGSDYVEGAVNWEFTPGWTLNAHAGKQWIRHSRAYDYGDWRLGVTKAWKNGYSIAVAYAGTDADKILYTNAHGNNIGGDTGVVTLSKSF